MTIIRTPRLLLRPAAPHDLPAIHAILSDAAAMAYWSSLPHETIEQTEAWLADMIAITPDLGEDFVIEHRGRVIGKAGLYRFPDIGYILHRDAWGQGFAQEALRPVLDRAFGVHGLPAVVADVDPRNAPSLRLLERLGFRETGRRAKSWFIGGVWADSVDLKLDAAQWAAQQATSG